MLFNIGFGELLILAVIAFVLFGPKAFLRNIRRLGVYWGRFQAHLSKFTDDAKYDTSGGRASSRAEVHETCTATMDCGGQMPSAAREDARPPSVRDANS